MAFPIAVVLLTTALSAVNAYTIETASLSLNIKSNGSYSISSQDGTLLLDSGSSSVVGYSSDGQWISALNGLTLASEPSPATVGNDNLGEYKRMELQWMFKGATTFATAFRLYDTFIVFEQIFPVDINNMQQQQPSILSTAFPSWDTTRGVIGSGEMGSLGFSDIGNGEAALFPPTNMPEQQRKESEDMIQPAYLTPSTWKGGVSCKGQSEDLKYGDSCSFQGTHLTLFNKNQSIVMISSALQHFDNTLQARVGAMELRTGLLGSIITVPAGFKTESILYIGKGGINSAYQAWGSLLLSYYNRPRTSFSASLATSHLGYSTTAGYFYTTEGAKGSYPNLIPGNTFEETLIHVYNYSKKEKIPYRWALLDSWWYGEYSHNGSGMYSWDESSAMEPDALNPNGRFPNGLMALRDKLGGPSGMGGGFIQHMGKWRADTHYVKNKNWGWTVYDRPGYGGTAWTDSPEFYDSLFGNATEWGLIAAKHDHVQEQIPETNMAMENLSYIERVLSAEAQGLATHGAHIMAGGYTMLGWFNSVRQPILTHGRVNADYACWVNKSSGVGVGCARGLNGNYWSFNMGPASMLPWSLGGLPYKDSFFSSQAVKGSGSCIAGTCLFANWTEPYPAVHALASVLSAGPVAPGDRIGGSNTTLIMQTCAADGKLLKPDRPATSIDSYWSVRAFYSSTPTVEGPRGEVWATEATLNGYTWMYLFGTMLNEKYELKLTEAIANTMQWPANRNPSYKNRTTLANHAIKTDFVAYNFYTQRIQAFDDENSLSFAPGIDYGAMTYYVACPKLANGWILLGETEKFIPISLDRVANMFVGDDNVVLTVMGKPGEKVSMSAMLQNDVTSVMDTTKADCIINNDGLCTITFKGSAREL
eukprot:m.195002 g.195002  ORF g.195002 m.195002 type:complete len:875 (+) comp15686_c0_seq3:99-2723(+)